MSASNPVSGAGWENHHLVPVVAPNSEDDFGYLQDFPDEHRLMVAVRAYTLAVHRAATRAGIRLPANFGQILRAGPHPYVAFSADEWRKARTVTCRTGFVSLGRIMVQHRPGKKRSTMVNGRLHYVRHAPVTHLTLQVAAALPRLPRNERGYYRAWMLHTPGLRVVDDRRAGGDQFAAAYSDLWVDLARRIEELIPLALADLLRRGVES